MEIPNTDALVASGYSVDLTSPEVVGFTFDLDAGQVILTFTELVQPLSYNASQFTIQASNDSIDPSISLTGGLETIEVQGSVLVITLTGTDLDILNRDITIATSQNTTYLSITAYSIQDTSNNRVAPIPSTDALQAADFIDDASGPTLEFFELNLDQRSLTLSFSETVNVSSLDLTHLTLQNAENNPTETYRRSDSRGFK